MVKYVCMMLVTAAALLATGCAGMPDDDVLLMGRSDGPAESYTFVFLVTDRPVDSFTEAQMREAMAGHFANMQRLAEEELLLIAGPLGEPRSDPDHRGVFVFDVDDIAEAQRLAETDPSVQAGVFATRIYSFRSTDALRDLPEWEREAAAARDAAPTGSAARNIRPYILASAAHGHAAEPLLAGEQRVLFMGRLGGGLDGTTIMALDATSMENAQQIIEQNDPEGVAAGQWTYHPWWASATIQRMGDDSSAAR